MEPFLYKAVVEGLKNAIKDLERECRRGGCDDIDREFVRYARRAGVKIPGGAIKKDAQQALKEAGKWAASP